MLLRNQRLGHFLLFVLLLATTGSLLDSGTARAASLALDPAAFQGTPGDDLFLDLVVSELGGDVVGDFDVDLLFDPTALSFSGYTLGAGLGDPTLGQAIDFSLGEGAPGLLDLAVVSTLPTSTLDLLQEAPFALATLQFQITGLSPGASTSLTLLLDALGDGAGVPLPVTSTSGAVVTALPEPGTGLLVALGLAAATALAARRRES